MSEKVFSKVIKELETEVALLKEELTSLNEALESRPTLLVMENVAKLKSENKALWKENQLLTSNALSKDEKIESLQELLMEDVEIEPCEIHGVKDCPNLKCIPTEVAKE